MSDIKCVHCIEVYMNDVEARRERGQDIPEGEHLPSWEAVRDADTMVPSWQTTSVLGQMVMACVPLPVCVHHLVKTKVAPQQMASRSGLALPGQ